MLLLCRTRRPHKRPHLCRRVEGVLEAEHERVRAAVEQREHVPLGDGVLQVLREGAGGRCVCVYVYVHVCKRERERAKAFILEAQL